MLNQEQLICRQLDRSWIAAHIPHQGSMCLLDRVVDWDTQQLHASASSHRLDSNPLRFRNRLGAVCAIEYAAQAMAVHGALLESSSGIRARAGLLISVRDTQFHRARLDDLDADLDIAIMCIHRAASGSLYRFTVHAAGKPVADGRAAVILDIDTSRELSS